MNKFPIELIEIIFSFNNEIKSLTSINKLLYSYRKYFNISCHEFCVYNFNSDFKLTKIYGITEMKNISDCKHLNTINEIIYELGLNNNIDGNIMSKMKNLSKLTILSRYENRYHKSCYEELIYNNKCNDKITYLTLNFIVPNIVFPKNLIYLDIYYMVNPLSELPKSLKYLIMHGFNGHNIDDLPKDLIHLDIQSKFSININYLPDKLLYLNLGNYCYFNNDGCGNKIIYLPDTIINLQINNGQKIYNIPKNVKIINFNNNEPSYDILRSFPKTLKQVKILKKYYFLKNVYENINFEFI